MNMLWALSHILLAPSVLRLWHYHDAGVMGIKQDSLQARKYLDQLEELLSDSDVQEMRLALINDLKLLGIFKKY